jgi:RNA polymerase sigma factor (sigma-70 family)
MISGPAEAGMQSSTAETELLKRFATGDLSAFEMLFRRYQAQVYGWIVRVVRDAGVAEDLTIETFWRIYRSRGRFDPDRSFGAWARKIASNLAIGHLKSMRPEESLPAEMAHSVGAQSNLQQHVRLQTARAFRELPARFQAVATLALVEECTYEEISKFLGIPVGTVKSRVFRAVRLLRNKLKHLGVEP